MTASFEQMLNESLSQLPRDLSPESLQNTKFLGGDWQSSKGISSPRNGEEVPLHLYPYAVSRHQLEQVIKTLQLPIVLTKDIESADVVLALRSHLRSHRSGSSKVRHLARHHQVPIHIIKSNTLPQMVRSLKRLLNHDDPSSPEAIDVFLSATNSNDELEALEEARLAVEQIVLPKGQPVELLPRPAHVRKMQHELVEHYRLKSASFGEEPNRRLRIYPP
jgi:hypothetical protein